MDDMKTITRGVKASNYHTTFTKRLWIFMCLGAVVIVFALITVGLYFHIQTVTTSTSQTEIFPAYYVSVVVTVTGFFVLILFWRRPFPVVVVTIVLCISCGIFCVTVAVLTVTQILQPITSLESCTYLKEKSSCTCESTYEEKPTVTFEQTTSCDSVESGLPVLLYIVCGLYLVVFALCAASALCAFLVWRLEQSRLRDLQEESYEEVFTVSGSSSSISDCDEDLTVETVARHNSSSAPNDPQNVIGKNSINGRNTCPPGILKNADKQQLPMTNELMRSKSCDSIDLIHSNEKSSTSSETPQKGKGKLKEHRRRDRRAVTLHNLDTKQLLLILDLQMRYLEESRQLKSQGNLSRSEKNLKGNTDSRRAITPQPYVPKKAQPNTLPKSIRSHTPQPGKSYEVKTMSEPRVKKKDENWLFRTNDGTLTADSFNVQKEKIKHQGRSSHGKSRSSAMATRKSSTDSDVGQVNVAPRPKSRPSVQQHFLPPEPIHRSKSVPVNQIMSRKSSHQSVLPPHPISRQHHHRDFLPVEAVQRNGSAFQIVGHPNKTNGPMQGRDAFSHDALYRTQGELSCERAIRDNFKLYASPFILRENATSGHSASASLSSASETPPAYTHPPSYQNFVSYSQDESSRDSVDENLYETYDFTHQQSQSLASDDARNQNETGIQTKDTKERKESQTSSLPESEDDVFLPNYCRGAVAPPQVYQEVTGRDSSVCKTRTDMKVPDILSHQYSQERLGNQFPYIPMYADKERRRKPKKRNEQIKNKREVAIAEKTNTLDNGFEDQKRNQTDPKTNEYFVPVMTSSGEECPRNDTPVYAISAKMKKSKPQNQVDMFNSSVNSVFMPNFAKEFPSGPHLGFNTNLSNGNHFIHAYPELKDHTHPELKESSPKGDKSFVPESMKFGDFGGYNANYEDVDVMRYTYHDDSTVGISSQASLLSSSSEGPITDYNRAIDELHPGLGDPHVLETMI